MVFFLDRQQINRYITSVGALNFFFYICMFLRFSLYLPK